MSNVSRSLHIEGEAARGLLANLRDVIEGDEELALTAVEGETNLIEAISAGVDRMSEVKTYCEALETKIKSLSERRSRFEDQAARIKTAIQVAMGHAELRKIELPQATLTIQRVAAKAEITDESAIPAKFWKPQDPKLDRKALLDALKAKEDVPGAVLSNGGETLAIR